jgi:hypothetical protein
MISIPNHLADRAYKLLCSVDFPIPESRTLTAIAFLTVYRLKNSKHPDSAVYSSADIRQFCLQLQAEELETEAAIATYLDITADSIVGYKTRFQVILDRQTAEREQYHLELEQSHRMYRELKLQNCSYQDSFL